MAAAVETMFYMREKPWHGLGTQVQEAPDSQHALELAGLDWQEMGMPGVKGILPEPWRAIWHLSQRLPKPVRRHPHLTVRSVAMAA